MAHAYTPGLKVARKTLVRKERRLPLPGKVIVSKGQRVKAEDVVAKADIPGNVHPVNVAGLLGVSPSELISFMIKKEGDKIKKGEIIAETKGVFGLFKNKVVSPCDGIIESISSVTGQVIIRENPIPVEVLAYIDGEVIDIIENEGVVVETTASFIQGIFGVGGEVIGILKLVVDSPEEELTPEKIPDDINGKILVGGSFITKEAIEEAKKKGAKGIVVGGIDDMNLKKFLGYDIGVAITGSENTGLTLIITEGFGKMKMAKRTFELLQELDGKKASCNGATQIRAGVIRPEIIVSHNERTKIQEEDESLKEGMNIGTLVRIIREPYFGRIGKVKSLPPELREIDTESKVRIVEVELDDGNVVIIPRANVEIIEE
ncbi:MAG: hypothetical protein ABIM49_01860 [candidate division WOR-3 bacterium]|uniref:KOW domain-containing protein n=1 Tax=candidate division WOR-3 bacterium TaxID=2052148 RepID=A0A7V4ABQ8_UNCW3